MTTSMLACGKASAYGSLRAHAATVSTKRSYASTAATAAAAAAAAATNSHNNGRHPPTTAEERADQRDLFVDILGANTTKREAKQYLARFRQQAKGDSKAAGAPATIAGVENGGNARSRGSHERPPNRTGVNLGGLYASPMAVVATPSFSSEEADGRREIAPRPIHIALVYLKSIELLDDETLDGLAVTLAQLVKLDMRLVIVLDSGVDADWHDGEQARPRGVQPLHDLLARQGRRLSAAVGRHSPEEGRVVMGSFEASEPEDVGSSSRGDHQARLELPNLLTEPLKRGIVTVVPAMAHTVSGHLTRVPGAEIMTTLTKKLARTETWRDSEHEGGEIDIFLDRIIVMDDIGGIPSKDRGHGAHVFVNLEQEFDDIEQELTEYADAASHDPPPHTGGAIYERHRKNLEMTQKCLALLPASSSAIILTPQEAASSSRKNQELTIGAGTRRRKNSLIHNLLTNKPLVSSSLPVARLPRATGVDGAPVAPSQFAATLVKWGMPLTVIPATYRGMGWQHPASGLTSLHLDQDPRINLPRLVHLIEDSFRRKLNVPKYLDRIRGRVAGLIVAGDYEGGAILTWEMPAGTDDPARLVPYLDKFAVLQSSQGSSGVADIVFQAMVRSAFPHGVCWRSRQDNPVNKWYLERSAGTWKIPGTKWTMFWTGDGIAESEQRWNDYTSVCERIQPSWAD